MINFARRNNNKKPAPRMFLYLEVMEKGKPLGLYELEDQDLTVGTGENCEIRVTGAANVETQHVKIYKLNDKVFVESVHGGPYVLGQKSRPDRIGDKIIHRSCSWSQGESLKVGTVAINLKVEERRLKAITTENTYLDEYAEEARAPVRDFSAEELASVFDEEDRGPYDTDEIKMIENPRIAQQHFDTVSSIYDKCASNGNEKLTETEEDSILVSANPSTGTETVTCHFEDRHSGDREFSGKQESDEDDSMLASASACSMETETGSLDDFYWESVPDTARKESDEIRDIVEPRYPKTARKDVQSNAESGALAKTSPRVSRTDLHQTQERSRESVPDNPVVAADRQPLRCQGKNAMYELLAPIGSGGMGSVYKAVRLCDNKIVAIKIPNPMMSMEESTRFNLEATVGIKLEHKNIVKIIDVAQDGRNPFLVMEFEEGQTLDEMLLQIDEMQETLESKDRVWTMRVELCLYVLIELADALEYLVSKELPHRDIKPSNIMFNKTVKLFDFGIAYHRSGGIGITTIGEYVGTAIYMAPECFEPGEKDGSCDVYSLGVAAYQILTGKLPFTDSNPMRLVLQKLSTKPVDPKTLNPEIPSKLRKLVLQMMHIKPSKRPNPGTISHSVIKVAKRFHKKAKKKYGTSLGKGPYGLDTDLLTII